ncbi:MAG TPA: zinc-dependent peptidase [Flavobacteriales bacterium]|nr:zinc-dependent peptidase [Flavobacteriales bacterium]
MNEVGFLVVVGVVLATALAIRRLRKGRGLWVRGLTPWERALLVKYVPHYGRLSAAGKQRFESITATFLHEKRWEGVGMELEEEMRVMIAASAAQLLLGRPEVKLRHFERFQVYANAYRSDRNDRWHQGEVQPRNGLVRISWRHFLHGYSDPRDAHNVALHELAHAFWFEDLIPNGEQGFLDPELKARWLKRADEVMTRIHGGEEVLFREYAGTNREEFFAVAVEYFFEQPREFLYEHPDLYDLLRGMLHQDPLREDGPLLPGVLEEVSPK